MSAAQEKTWSQKQKSFLNSLSSEDDAGVAKPIVGIRSSGSANNGGSNQPSVSTDVEQEDDDPDEIDISESKQRDPYDPLKKQQEMMSHMMSNRPPQFGDSGSSRPTDPFSEMMKQMGQQRGSSPGTLGSRGAPSDPFSMIQQMQQNADASGAPFPFPGADGGEGMPNMFTMMEQMMSSMGAGGPGGPNPFGAGGMNGGPFGASPTMPPQVDLIGRLWRMIHGASIFLLVVLLDRSSIPLMDSTPGIGSRSGRSVFWYFITLQLVLQSTRLFIYGPVLQNSIFTRIGGLLPPPFNGYAVILARYSLIFFTMKDDFFLLLMGLGARALLGR